MEYTDSLNEDRKYIYATKSELEETLAKLLVESFENADSKTVNEILNFKKLSKETLTYVLAEVCRDTFCTTAEDIKTLLTYGADPKFVNMQGNTLIMEVINGLNFEKYTDSEQRALEKIQVLSQNGVDILQMNNEGENAFLAARNLCIIKFLFEDCKKDPEISKIASIALNNIALHNLRYGEYDNLYETIEFLLKMGANPNARYSDFYQDNKHQDSRDMTSFELLFWSGDYNFREAQLMYDNGATINAEFLKNNPEIMLDFAYYMNDLDLGKKAVQSGLDLKQFEIETCVDNNDVEFLDFLVKLGKPLDNVSKKSLKYAKNNCEEIYQYLIVNMQNSPEK